MYAQLKTEGRRTFKSEDRVTQIQKVIDDERLHQQRLDDTVGRVLAKQRIANTELEEAHGIAKNLETDNMVRRAWMVFVMVEQGAVETVLRVMPIISSSSSLGVTVESESESLGVWVLAQSWSFKPVLSAS